MHGECLRCDVCLDDANLGFRVFHGCLILFRVNEEEGLSFSDGGTFIDEEFGQIAGHLRSDFNVLHTFDGGGIGGLEIGGCALQCHHGKFVVAFRHFARFVAAACQQHDGEQT